MVKDAKVSAPLPFNIAPVVIVGLGAFIVLASLVMPTLSSTDVTIIHNNMMVETHPAVALAVVAAIISVVRYWNVRSVSSANLAIFAGFWFFGWTLFDAFTEKLHRIGCDQCLLDTSAAAGLYASGLGCLMIALGGLMMRFPQRTFGLITGAAVPDHEISAMPQTKVCPRCAENVKAAAAVCRFCGHEFHSAAVDAQSPLATRS